MIYFVLPVYNEEENIEAVITKLRSAMSDLSYKIIVVNDGSLDSSLKILKALRDDRLKIETYYVNMNIGAVFSTGISSVLSQSVSDDDIMIIMESDQTSEISLAKKLIAQIEQKNKDLVIASRYKSSGKYKNFPLIREIFSKGANTLMHLCFPIEGVFDYTIFFRAYRVGILREAVKYFGPCGLIQSKGFAANAEILVKLSLITDKIAEVGFTYNYAKKIGVSKIRVLRTINEYFVLINHLRRLKKKWRLWQNSNIKGGR